nr:probable tRNA N6-adenosine threonylcarbamoyltransferase, mitochondrial [Ipomoea batatas]
MATIFPNLSSTIFRVNPFYKPSLYLTIRGFNKLGAQQGPLRPAHSILRTSFKSLSAQLSSSNFNPEMAQTQNQLIPDKSLVFLGIETSCDDTAAAVVNSNGEILSQVISSQNCLLNMEELLLKWQKKHMHRLLIRYAILLPVFT